MSTLTTISYRSTHVLLLFYFYFFSLAGSCNKHNKMGFLITDHLHLTTHIHRHAKLPNPQHLSTSRPPSRISPTFLTTSTQATRLTRKLSLTLCRPSQSIKTCLPPLNIITQRRTCRPSTPLASRRATPTSSIGSGVSPWFSLSWYL